MAKGSATVLDAAQDARVGDAGGVNQDNPELIAYAKLIRQRSIWGERARGITPHLDDELFNGLAWV